MKRTQRFLTASMLISLFTGSAGSAQPQLANLLLREAVKVVPSCLPGTPSKAKPEAPGTYLPGDEEIPLTADCLVNSELELKLYGGGKGELKLAHVHSPPMYIWSGLVHSGNWAVTFKDPHNYADLTGPGARIRWRIKEAGFHQLRPVVKLADGTLLVGDYADGHTVDWKESEFLLGDVHWRGLDGDAVVESPDGKIRENVDLSQVDEIGFTDMALGSGHGQGGASRVEWMEVYGRPRQRAASTR